MPSPSSSPRSWGSSIFHRLRLRLLRWRSKFHYLLASLREYSPLYQWCIFASHPALGPYSYDFGFLCDVSYKLTTWTQNLFAIFEGLSSPCYRIEDLLKHQDQYHPRELRCSFRCLVYHFYLHLGVFRPIGDLFFSSISSLGEKSNVE